MTNKKVKEKIPVEMQLTSIETNLSQEGEFTNVVKPTMLKLKATTSYSIIVCTIINGELFYLIGRVRDSIPFKEFIKCNIKHHDMHKYISNMTQEEKWRLANENFNSLLDDVIVNHNSRAYKHYCNLTSQFEINRNKYSQLLNDPSIGLSEAQWLFPKGRKQDGESEMDCALREFEEETHINRYLINYYNNWKYEESYQGLDCQTYRTVYFLGYLDYELFKQIADKIRDKFVTTHMRTSLSEEIYKVKFFSYEAASQKLNDSKQMILRLANTYLIFKFKRDEIKRRYSI